MYTIQVAQNAIQLEAVMAVLLIPTLITVPVVYPVLTGTVNVYNVIMLVVLLSLIHI